jgi:RNA polymerase sigma-70 factor, Bacteroides expansion family 1
VTTGPVGTLYSVAPVSPASHDLTGHLRALSGSLPSSLHAAEEPRPRERGKQGGRAFVSSDERALMARLSAGDGAAFTTLFERYYDALCAFAAGFLTSRAEAEEIVEDVFVRVWELRERLEVRDSMKSYLYAATRNRALNQLRRERLEWRWVNDETMCRDVPEAARTEHGIDDELYAADFARAIDVAVDRLPPRCRQVFLLHRQHGLTYSEIAVALGISPKTVENQLGRALKQLRTLLANFLSE